MAITRILEDAILKGWATYKKYTHAYSSFGSILIPKDEIVIVTDISWTPFFNPLTEDIEEMTWRDLFAYSEYQLKIESEKSLNYLQFRNEFKWRWLGIPIDVALDEEIDLSIFNTYFLPEHSAPIQKDVFFIMRDHMKITISRNTGGKTMNQTTGPVSSTANEKIPPIGIDGLNVGLRYNLNPTGGDAFDYTPASNEFSGLSPALALSTENYMHYQCQSNLLLPIDTESTDYGQFPFHISPLVEFGIVSINSSKWDMIANQK